MSREEGSGSAEEVAKAPEKAPAYRELDLSGCGTRSLAPELFRYEFLTVLHIGTNNLTTIPAAIARLTALVYLDASSNKISSITRSIHKCSRLQQLILVRNLLTSVPAELALLSDLSFLALDENPLQEPFASLKSKSTPQLIGYLRDNSREFVPQPPEERTWVTLDPTFNLASDDPDLITVFSMNILSPMYATDQIYPYCPSWALNWDYRKERIMDELFKYKPDVVCLQEMETEQYEVYFKTKLQRQGYQGIFCPKSRAKTMSESEAKGVDGSAIFFRESKFALLKEKKVEFSALSMSKPEFRQGPDIFNRVMPKDNVAIVALLKVKHTGIPVIVANPHLTWDPYYKDVKLIQSALLMQELEDFRLQFPTLASIVGFAPSSRTPAIPTIICGDFNSLPDSGVYSFLSTGSLAKNHPDFGRYKYPPFTTDGLSHSIDVVSTYSLIGEPPYTNHTSTFHGTIDYIWHTPASLRPVGILGPVPKEYADRTFGFPNPHLPSDHICLAAQYRLNLPFQRRNQRA